jgi:adenylyltransferase/sulfurtransferase
MPLTFDEEHRYSRHLILPGVGAAGQERLKRGRVLLVGAGGLGSPAALYLAAAGVGTLGIADGDTLDVTNLQRQVLHRTADVGRQKAESAADTLTALNPLVTIQPIRERITAGNALALLAEYDVVIDGTDNFPTRYLLNDACALLGRPLVFGSVYRFEGQATVFDARRGPCYRCLFPHPPAPERVPSCAEGGVLGVLPGLIGTIQAAEALKLLLGIGESLLGRLLLVETQAMRFRELAIEKNLDCPLCGTAPTITGLVDYEEFCGIGAPRDDDIIAPETMLAKVANGSARLVDLREAWELEADPPLPGAMHLPYPTFTRRMSELDSSSEVILYCSTGIRGALAVRLLRRAGYTRVANLHGGLAALRAHQALVGA